MLVAFFIASNLFASSCFSLFGTSNPPLYFNTSNPHKERVWTSLFREQKLEVEFNRRDLREIEASPIDIAVHKASQFKGRDKIVIIEDSALYVAGLNVGTNIRWLVDNLPKWEGRNARWEIVVAYRQGEKVFVFVDSVKGVIGKAVSNSDTFNSSFYPIGSRRSMEQLGPNHPLNPRYRVFQRILENRYDEIRSPIEQWNGPWQGH